MVTKRQLIYDIKEIMFPKGTQNTDIPEEQISYWIDNARAILIRQDYEKKRSINQDNVQSLGCVELCQVDESECPCLVTGCYILRTKVCIPRTIETYQKNMFTRIGPISLNAKPYPMVDYHRVPWLNKDKFTKKITKSFLHNGYIYLVSNEQLEAFINIQGIFEDPTEVSAFTNCDGSSCFNIDSEYPISRHMIEPLKQLVMETNKGVMGVSDVKNNNTEDKPTDLK